MKKIVTILQKYGLISLCLIIILTNIGLLLYRTKSGNPKSDVQYQSLFQIENAFRAYAEVSRSSLIRTIDQLNIILPKSSQYIGFFVTPSPCDGCLNKQIDLWNSYEKKQDSLVVIAPNSRLRDIRVSLPSAMVIGYEPMCIDRGDSIVGSFDGVIWLNLQAGVVEDVFVANSFFPELSISFFDGILSD